MNHEESDFYELRKLLALKRHEQPPPGYFDRLHSNIAAAIHEPAEENLWVRLLNSFSIKPILAATFGVAVFSSLGFGLFHSVTTESQSANLAFPPVNLAELSLADLAERPELPVQVSTEVSNPVLEHFVQPVSLHGPSLGTDSFSIVRQ